MITFLIIGIIILIGFQLTIRKVPTDISYGVSFSKLHANELGLDWKKAYDAIIHDLGVKKIRLSAHWPETEPAEGKYNFSTLEYQIKGAEQNNVDVILGVGRRLPGWPECHEPEWSWGYGEAKKKDLILDYIGATVAHFKGSPAIKMWQVENEAFLASFATYHCRALDESFLQKEIDLVRKLDPSRPVLMTDSGEFGRWLKPHTYGDVFGTTMYLYTWHKDLGFSRYPIGPGFFRAKQNILDLLGYKKPRILVELAAEPWLPQAIIDTPVETQLSRMGIDKLNEMIDFASKTGFETQYLWGAEWWYWLKSQGHPEYWERAKVLFGAK
ncbi:beta-galactosidase [Candidatus Parcubacteria bacterium]|nr:beta-galactosidase [Candidatus Parcubacteria bacterium]